MEEFEFEDNTDLDEERFPFESEEETTETLLVGLDNGIVLEIEDDMFQPI